MNLNSLNDFFSESILNNVGLSGSCVEEKIRNYIVPLQCDDLPERLSGLKLITNELLPLLAEENLSDVFEHVMPCSNSIVDLILDRVVHLVNSEDHKDFGCTLQNIKGYLTMALEVTQNIYNILEYIIKNKVNVAAILNVLPMNALEIVLKIFSHCKESKNIYKNYFDSLGEIVNLFKKGQDVNSKMMSVLENQLLFANLRSEDVIILGKIVELLGEIGETVSGMNAKATLETWKGYINLLQKLLDNADQCNVSFSQPLNFFSSEVKTNVNLILELNNSNECDTKTLQQTLKLTSFLVKIACRVCSFQKRDNSYVDVINFLSAIYCFSPSYIEFKNYPPNAINLLKISVFDPCDSLCQECFKDHKFHEDAQNLRPLIADNIKGFTILIFLIFDHIIAENKVQNLSLHKYIQISFSLVDNVDDEFFEDLLIFSKFPNINNFYDVLVLKCALLFNHMTNSELNESESILLAEILSQNVEHALMATDIWINVIGSNGYDLLCNLVDKSFELFSVNFCERPESILLGNFLSQIFTKLPVNYKTKFIDKYPPQDNVSLWKYIKLSNVPQSAEIIDCLLRKFLENSKMLYSKNISRQEFAYLCDVCDTLSTAGLEETSVDLKFVKNELIKLWAVNTSDKEVVNVPCFPVFLEKLTKITGQLVPTLNCEDVLKITQKMNALLNLGFDILLFTLDFMVFLSSVNFEKNRNEIVSEIINIFTKGLTSQNPLIVQESLEHFEEFFRNTPHQQQTYHFLSKNEISFKKVKDYLQRTDLVTEPTKFKECFKKIKENDFVHGCLKWPEVAVSKNKKLKSDCGDEVVAVVERIKKDVGLLRSLHRFRSFPDETVANIVQISDELQEIFK